VAGLTADFGLCWDLGDVIFSEATEIFDSGGITERVVLIPGIGDLLLSLAARGIPMAVVSDTRIGACDNVLSPHGLEHCFSHRTISEALGVEKPHPSMFESASAGLGLPLERLAMVGNHYYRDIEGAGAVGMTAIWFHWNDRYPSPSSTPAADYIAADAWSLSEAIEGWIAGLAHD
jgi:FMN phosphatase YigB (HAD superfamily)